MIRKFFDCSSGHLSPDTWTWLNAELADNILRDPGNTIAAGIAGRRTRYGWFVYAPTETCIDIPADLRCVCALARARGAEYVSFDCDAPPDKDLPLLHPDFIEPSAVCATRPARSVPATGKGPAR